MLHVLNFATQNVGDAGSCQVVVMVFVEVMKVKPVQTVQQIVDVQQRKSVHGMVAVSLIVRIRNVVMMAVEAAADNAVKTLYALRENVIVGLVVKL